MFEVTSMVDGNNLMIDNWLEALLLLLQVVRTRLTLITLVHLGHKRNYHLKVRNILTAFPNVFPALVFFTKVPKRRKEFYFI